MKKARYDLSASMIDIPKEAQEKEETNSLRQGMTVKIDRDFKKELKIWCAKNNINISDAVTTALKKLMASY